MAAKGTAGKGGGGLKDFFTGLLVGVILTALTGWYVAIGRKSDRVRQAQNAVASGIETTVGAIESRIDAFELRGKDIKEDLAQTGRVVRRSVRAVGGAVADATSDTRLTAAIKAKLAMNSELSAWNISVTTTDGVVTLAGSVATHDQIGKAILLALETDGVKEVASTLRVRGG